MQAFVSSVITIVVYAVILAAVVKMFQIGKDLSEIKDLLQDIKRNTTDYAASPPHAPAPEPMEWKS